jgi:hypothetical protein
VITNPKLANTYIKWAGVNQQPPVHQCRMRPFKPFGDEPKTHPSLPKVLGFFSLFSAPKFFLPTYLPPTYLTSFCTHSIVKALKNLKRENKTKSQKWQLGQRV